ncbi:hypothetical protein BJ875DRAFT_439295 [Amylocarpus encephaloides]|uniref:Uncharacterized protein n=1 Tax=Amylocarpus encephaloides TaxID=45428 RepID=A0A9P8C786_9HELO|nr:hypothetical protein BJ875DRAFT_439295 [Amylocarpus encephaloides]
MENRNVSNIYVLIKHTFGTRVHGGSVFNLRPTRVGCRPWNGTRGKTKERLLHHYDSVFWRLRPSGFLAPVANIDFTSPSLSRSRIPMASRLPEHLVVIARQRSEKSCPAPVSSFLSGFRSQQQEGFEGTLRGSIVESPCFEVQTAPRLSSMCIWWFGCGYSVFARDMSPSPHRHDYVLRFSKSSSYSVQESNPSIIPRDQNAAEQPVITPNNTCSALETGTHGEGLMLCLTLHFSRTPTSDNSELLFGRWRRSVTGSAYPFNRFDSHHQHGSICGTCISRGCPSSQLSLLTITLPGDGDSLETETVRLPRDSLETPPSECDASRKQSGSTKK